jgi:RNA polymerase sigma factor (sigma-70 family)
MSEGAIDKITGHEVTLYDRELAGDTSIETVVEPERTSPKSPRHNADLIPGLIKEHNSEFLRYALKITGGNHHDAEDLVHEAYEKLVEQIETMSTDNLRAWMFTAMTNKYRSQLRHKDVVVRANKKLIMRYIAEEESVPTPEFIRKELSPDLANALEILPKSYRRVLEEVAEGASYNEVARRQNIPIGTAMSRLHRARNILKERLKGKYSKD